MSNLLCIHALTDSWINYFHTVKTFTHHLTKCLFATEPNQHKQHAFFFIWDISPVSDYDVCIKLNKNVISETIGSLSWWAASQGLRGQKVTTCWISCSWCCYSKSHASSPQIAGPCRCHSAHPEAKRMQTSGSYCFLWNDSFLTKMRIHFCLTPSMCVGVCIQAEVKVFSYITVVWLLAGYFLKCLKCSHTSHVTVEFKFKTKVRLKISKSLFRVVSIISFSHPTRPSPITFTSTNSLSLPHLIIHAHTLCKSVKWRCVLCTKCSLLHAHIPQVCDCKWIFFEILSVICIFIQERSQRNIIFPILLKRLDKVGH